MKKHSGMIWGIVIIIILVFVIVTRHSLGYKSILGKSKESVWNDKGGRYTVIKTTIKGLDSCNVLSYITRVDDFKRLDCVYKIGDNEHFIIAETKAQQYWVINKDKDSSSLTANQIIDGPFDSTEFINRKKELNINDLDFQKEF